MTKGTLALTGAISGLFLITQILGLNSAQAEPCGLKGKLKDRIKNCKKIADKKAEFEFISISRDKLDDPLAGIEEKSNVVWTLVSEDNAKNQLWKNKKTGEGWMLLAEVYEEPIPDFILQDFGAECNKKAETSFAFKQMAFDVPSLDEIKEANDQGLLRAFDYMTDLKLALRNRTSNLIEIGVDDLHAPKFESSMVRVLCRTKL